MLKPEEAVDAKAHDPDVHALAAQTGRAIIVDHLHVAIITMGPARHFLVK